MPHRSVSCYTFIDCGLILLKDFFSYLCFTPSFRSFNVLIDEFVCMYNNIRKRQNENEQQKELPMRTTTTTAKNQRQENKAIYQSYVNFYF